MTVARCFLLNLLAFAVFARAQPGFISIDCGIAEDFNYTENATQVFFTSDAKFIDTGTNSNLPYKSMTDDTPPSYRTLRSFPDGTRNCYTLPVVKSNKYLIRAGFMYGNYDNLDKPPKFDVYVDTNRWDVDLPPSAYQYCSPETITSATRDYISVCLVNTGLGTPYINVLKSRLLDNSTYQGANQTHFLRLFTRIFPGQTGDDKIRYPEDVYDRSWIPWVSSDWTIINTSSSSSASINLRKDLGYQPPLRAMKSAFVPSNPSRNLQAKIPYFGPTFQHHVFLHFAELEQLQPNQSREFTISVDGVNQHGPFSPKYLSVDTVQIVTNLNGRDVHTVQLQRTRASTLPPILNAYEIYIIQRSLSPTNDQDVKAMIDIKAMYKVKRNWMGDPCLPNDYLWEGLNCSSSDSGLPTIISLDLSSTGLNGEIAPSFSNLKFIRYLDLSENNLNGTIPKFLGELPSLSRLNLTGNQFTGRVPSNLLERSKRGLLKLSVDNNPNLNFSDPSDAQSIARATNRRKITIPIVASIASVVFLSLLIILWTLKWRKRDHVVKANKAHGLIHTNDGILCSENRRFTHAEVVKMTNNFERAIGNGGFGTVYLGQVRNGTQVAVKMLFPQSVKSLSHRCQGLNEFQNEVRLLTRMHHKNLVPFIGYCEEGDKIALIYEYMAQGNLASHLSGKSSQSLSWSQRLHIALDVAQGLEYLHNYCKPPIIHRDVKATNILLNENFEAKIGDFGMSKVFHKDDGQTHVSTAIMGTHGYLDPEYYSSNHLTKKSDVYSFGVVVLQLITGHPAIIQTSDYERMNITEWIRPFVAEGNIQGMIDPGLEGDYDVNSIWKAVEIALACIPPRSIERPTMGDVVVELKECLETEIAKDKNRSTKIEQVELSSSFYPLPR